MLDKLSISEMISYFLSGLVVALGVGFANRLTVESALTWVKVNPWAADFSPIAVFSALLLLAGCFCFTLYRTIGYDWIALRIKSRLARLPWTRKRFYSYRELIQTLMASTPITTFDAERLQSVLKRRIASEFYVEAVGKINASIHLLYFTSLVFAISFTCAERWWCTLGSIVLFVVALYIDAWFEQQELLVFVTRQKELEAELDKFRAHFGSALI